MKERQELWCHECQKYVQFDIDVSLNGQHIILCPSCGHEHLRIVENGVITEARWGSSNNNAMNYSPYSAMQTFMTTGMTTSAASTYNLYTNSVNNGATTAFTYMAWMNTGNFS